MIQEQLDQNAIDSMFNHPAKVQEVLPVNFAKRSSITAEQMQSLVSLNQMFSQSLSVNLSSWLGANIKILMVAAERSMFPALLETIDLPNTYLTQSRFRSPDARALICMDLALVEPVVHLGLGGLTAIPASRGVREPTQIDVAIMEILLNTICSEMNQMWAPFGLQAVYEARILPSNAARLFPQTEYVLCFTYEIQIGPVQGVMQVALATAVASMLLRGVGGRDGERVQPPAIRTLLQERLEAIPFRTTLRLPPFKVRASEIISLQPGAVLRSTLPRSTSATFFVPGGPSWEAVPAVSDGRIAAKLVKLHPVSPIQG